MPGGAPNASCFSDFSFFVVRATPVARGRLFIPWTLVGGKSADGRPMRGAMKTPGVMPGVRRRSAADLPS